MSELTVLTKYEQYINEPEKAQDQVKQEKDGIPYVLGSLKRIGAVDGGPNGLRRNCLSRLCVAPRISISSVLLVI